MSQDNGKTDIRSITQTMISAIESMSKTGADKAILAALRHSAGKPLSQSSDIWAFLFQYIPERYLSENGQETKGENAICTSLELYALYRQGNSFYSSKDNVNFGGSINKVRNIIGDEALDKRMNMILTSEDFGELSYRLRQMIKLCKSRGDLTVNFAKLAEDLYWWINGGKDRVRISWAQSYYSQYKTDREPKENIENHTKEERK